MIEIFGYIGCIFVIISMLMTSVVKLRVINIYNLIKLSKADGNHYDMIRGDKEDSYLTYFIKHYKEDMKKYFLENTLELSAADTIYIVCCEGVPAGVLAERKKEMRQRSALTTQHQPTETAPQDVSFMRNQQKRDIRNSSVRK